jgi:hypothetical protein
VCAENQSLGATIGLTPFSPVQSLELVEDQDATLGYLGSRGFFVVNINSVRDALTKIEEMRGLTSPFFTDELDAGFR